MSATFDPSWGVPVIGVTIAVAGCLWAYLSKRAFIRKYGPGPR